MTYTERELENALLEHLQATEDLLKEWESNPYYADGSMVGEFWDNVRRAPGCAVIGDYDVDGICATYIMGKSIQKTCPGKKVFLRIPKRFSEGYGINETIAQEIREKLPVGSVVITVDNGIAAADLLESLEADGYKVLMTDHHSLKEGCRVPKVTMAINPSVPELSSGFDFKKWCGAAVAFKLCEQVVDEKMAKEMEVYAGIATVADCMDLKQGNWGLVRKAISAFREKRAPQCLANMMIEMKQDPSFASEDTFGYYLGPCFNAAGRLVDNGGSQVLKYLFAPTDEKLAQLIELNNKRKSIRDEEYELVKKRIAETGQLDACPIWVNVPGLHEGIVGILAGKVAEDYGVPAIVMTTLEENPNILKGSARSVGDFNVFLYLSEMAHLFTRMGGHAGAAGLSMDIRNFDDARAHQIPMGKKAMEDNVLNLYIQKNEIPSINTVLSKYRPFGEGNPAPVFTLDIDLEEEKTMNTARMIGSNKEHLLIEGPNKSYKITHFGHKDNNLSNKEQFRMLGKIAGSAYAGIETPTFNVENVQDITEEKEKSR